MHTTMRVKNNNTSVDSASLVALDTPNRDKEIITSVLHHRILVM